MKEYHLMLGKDLQDLKEDFIKASTYAMATEGKVRDSFLKMRRLLEETIKVIEKELENY